MLDCELVVLSSQGNKDAYAILVERYQGLIFGLAYHFLTSRAEAEEVAQEAFVRVYQQIIKDRSLNFLPYIKRVASNLCLDRLRQRQKEQKLLKNPRFQDIVEETTSLERLVIQEEVQSLRRALNRLPQMYKEILLLYYVGEIAQKEIAQKLNLPLSIVKNRIFRGKRILKDIILEGEGGS